MQIGVSVLSQDSPVNSWSTQRSLRLYLSNQMGEKADALRGLAVRSEERLDCSRARCFSCEISFPQAQG